MTDNNVERSRGDISKEKLGREFKRTGRANCRCKEEESTRNRWRRASNAVRFSSCVPVNYPLTEPRAHLLPASSIVAAHLAPQLASQQSQLNAKLQTTQSQNAAFFQTLAAQKKEIEILLDGLEASVKDLENANQALNSEVGTLRQDIRDADVEMNGL
jgi:septal ring factor EnvC (AmiA/AmiB activator)